MFPLRIQPLPLTRAKRPFSHPDWLFELKWDGFRSIARIENGRCKLISLTERKAKLRAMIRPAASRLFYCDHVEHDGEKLFQLACQRDLEGIVAKRKSDPYLAGHAMWQKIRNQNYSQWAGREKLFDLEREQNPDAHLWESCTRECEEMPEAS